MPGSSVGRLKPMSRMQVQKKQFQIQIKMAEAKLNQNLEDKASTLAALRQKITWKHGLLLLIPTFLLYPRPFLFLLRPFIRRVRRSYKKEAPKLERLILSPKRQMTAEKVVKSKLYHRSAENISIINLFQSYPQTEDSSSLQRSVSWNEALTHEPTLFLRAQNAILRIKMLSFEIAAQAEQNFAILIKGSPELLRVIEAKIYGMDSTEYYKIPMFYSQEEIHILEASVFGHSYQQMITKVKE